MFLNQVNACSAASEATAAAELIAFCPTGLSISFIHSVGINRILLVVFILILIFVDFKEILKSCLGISLVGINLTFYHFCP